MHTYIHEMKIFQTHPFSHSGFQTLCLTCNYWFQRHIDANETACLCLQEKPDSHSAWSIR